MKKKAIFILILSIILIMNVGESFALGSNNEEPCSIRCVPDTYYYKIRNYRSKIPEYVHYVEKSSTKSEFSVETTYTVSLTVERGFEGDVNLMIFGAGVKYLRSTLGSQSVTKRVTWTDLKPNTRYELIFGSEIVDTEGYIRRKDEYCNVTNLRNASMKGTVATYQVANKLK